jgi:hypothetical protein
MPLIKIRKILAHKGVTYGFETKYLDRYYHNGEKIEKIDRPIINYYPNLDKSILKSDAIVPINQKLINSTLYDSYLYKLLIAQFIHIISTERNSKIRIKLKNISRENIISLTISREDKNKLLRQINFCPNKEVFRETIKNSVYDFDHITLNNLRELKDRQEIIKKLQKILIPYLHLVDKPKDIKINNIFTSCLGTGEFKEDYCQGKKLIVPRGKIKSQIELLAADIMNHYKAVLLLSLSKGIINFYNFEKSISEDIIIK